MPCNDGLSGPRYKRRTILGLVLALLFGRSTRAADSEDESDKPPAPDDRFTFLTGPKKGQVVHAEDLALGGPQMQAFPMAPDGTVRNNRINLVILARFDPATLSEETRSRAADGVVAYTAVCTHQGCPVNMWSTDRKAFVCSCHGSIFDPRNDAEVLFGPAPRPLPALGLKLKEGVVTVASTFTGRVGGTQG
jgi:rieske iron-sulfur protein